MTAMPPASPVLVKRRLTPRKPRKALRSVASRKGAYSEALLVTGSGSGIVRLAVDAITYWTVTSDPADLARWQAARAETAGDPRAALERILGRPLAEGNGHPASDTALTPEEVRA